MFESLKKFLKVYPLPIFVLLLSFVIYYSAFELLRKKENDSAMPQTEVDSMFNKNNQTIQTATNNIEPVDIQPNQPQPDVIEKPQEPQDEPIQTPKTYITSNTKSLNIRQEPNTTSDVIGKLTPSHKATILEERGEWILIGTFEDNKVLGWILKRFSQEIPQEVTISTEPTMPTNTIPQLPAPEQSLTQNEAQIQKTEESKPLEVAQSTPEAPLYTSRVPSLNIRQLPSTDTPIIGKLTPNDSVIIVETQDVWVRILDANTPSVKNGWVIRRSLTLRP